MEIGKDPVVQQALQNWKKSEADFVSFLTAECIFLLPNMTPIEQIAFFALKGRAPWEAMRIYPQKTIGKYRVDFLVDFEFNRHEKIIVECDGHAFHEKTKEQAQHDKKRDRELQALGYRVYRFTGSEIWKTRGQCVLSALGIQPDGE